MADDDKKPDPKGDDDKKPDPKGDDDKLGDAGKRALDEERRARRDAEKKLKDAADKLKDLEDRDKSENQKLTDRVAEAEKDAAEARAELLRLSVGATKGLTPSQAKRLVGTTKEELESDADDFLTDLGGGDEKDDTDKNKPATRPQERLRGGGDPTEDPVETNPAKLAESVRRF